MEVVGFLWEKRCTKKSERKLKGIFTVYFRLEGVLYMLISLSSSTLLTLFLWRLVLLG